MIWTLFLLAVAFEVKGQTSPSGSTEQIQAQIDQLDSKSQEIQSLESALKGSDLSTWKSDADTAGLLAELKQAGFAPGAITDIRDKINSINQKNGDRVDAINNIKKLLDLREQYSKSQQSIHDKITQLKTNGSLAQYDADPLLQELTSKNLAENVRWSSTDISQGIAYLNQIASLSSWLDATVADHANHPGNSDSTGENQFVPPTNAVPQPPPTSQDQFGGSPQGSQTDSNAGGSQDSTQPAMPQKGPDWKTLWNNDIKKIQEFIVQINSCGERTALEAKTAVMAIAERDLIGGKEFAAAMSVSSETFMKLQNLIEKALTAFDKCAGRFKDEPLSCALPHQPPSCTFNEESYQMILGAWYDYFVLKCAEDGELPPHPARFEYGYTCKKTPELVSRYQTAYAKSIASITETLTICNYHLEWLQQLPPH